ncbi:coenzyme F420-dependent N5,N11-methylene tetrahydromethanopterin reductase [Gluconacetobacter sacchari DSM 12717]|nr:coenzyme F420-dependent N5,N11-methylene tetrahydromethanopterin reductase [Gluconacetobacter sacchari DSM 12717]
MHLFAYLKTGPTALHAGGWRHPDAVLDDFLEPGRYQAIARTLEQACFDGCFFADLQGLYDIHGGGFDTYVRRGGQISFLDPMVVLPVMAAVTSRLGLGATLSTSFLHPYHLARALLSMDVLSKGRMAWNIVTSATDLEARNYGMDEIADKAARYERADEVVEACMKLWKSWDKDAFTLDKESGLFADPAKVHYANYEGRYVRTRGPLSIPQSAQGHPVLMQAGSSPRGIQFAARWAEIVFAPDAADDKMQENYRTLKQGIVAADRSPDDCALCVQTTCIVAETDSMAQERADYVNALATEELNMATVSANSGVDVSRLAGSESVADLAKNQGIHEALSMLETVQRERGAALRQTLERRLPNMIVGSYKTVADRLEAMFTSGCCDGFVLTPVMFPGSHESFCRMVVPELQRRGLFRTHYTGTTLREHLGTTPGR